MEFLTTSEAADYLRLGERKLYELVTEGAIPCSKVTGKWLFPRHELDLWVLSGLARPAGMLSAEPPPIVGGSQDDLLEWSLRESGSGLASLTEGTARGVERLLRGEVIAAAVHFHSHVVPEDAADDDNIANARAIPGLHDAVLVGVARREQGLLLAPGNPKKLNSLADVLGARAHRPRSRRGDPRRKGRLRRRAARRGDCGGARFCPAGPGKFRSPDAAAQLFQAAVAGPDRLSGRQAAAATGHRTRRLRRGAGGPDPLRRLTASAKLTRTAN